MAQWEIPFQGFGTRVSNVSILSTHTVTEISLQFNDKVEIEDLCKSIQTNAKVVKALKSTDFMISLLPLSAKSLNG